MNPNQIPLHVTQNVLRYIHPHQLQNMPLMLNNSAFMAQIPPQQQQNYEMGDLFHMFSTVTEENDVLKRNLSDVKEEHSRLKKNYEEMTNLAEKLQKRINKIVRENHPAREFLEGMPFQTSFCPYEMTDELRAAQAMSSAMHEARYEKQKMREARLRNNGVSVLRIDKAVNTDDRVDVLNDLQFVVTSDKGVNTGSINLMTPPLKQSTPRKVEKKEEFKCEDTTLRKFPSQVGDIWNQDDVRSREMEPRGRRGSALSRSSCLSFLDVSSSQSSEDGAVSPERPFSSKYIQETHKDVYRRTPSAAARVTFKKESANENNYDSNVEKIHRKRANTDSNRGLSTLAKKSTSKERHGAAKTFSQGDTPKDRYRYRNSSTGRNQKSIKKQDENENIREEKEKREHFHNQEKNKEVNKNSMKRMDKKSAKSTFSHPEDSACEDLFASCSTLYEEMELRASLAQWGYTGGRSRRSIVRI